MAEFVEADRWVAELKSGREVIFDGVRETVAQTGIREVRFGSESVQSLGQLPAEASRVLMKVFESGIKAEEAALMQTPPTDDAAHVQSVIAAKQADSVAGIVRLEVLRRMLADGDYLTVRKGARVPRPPGYTVTKCFGYRMGDGQLVDVYFPISHARHPEVNSAMEVSRAQKEVAVQACIAYFQSLSVEERADFVRLNAERAARLADPGTPYEERAFLQMHMLPDDLEIVDGIVRRRIRR